MAHDRNLETKIEKFFYKIEQLCNIYYPDGLPPEERERLYELFDGWEDATDEEAAAAFGAGHELVVSLDDAADLEDLLADDGTVEYAKDGDDS